MKTHCDHYSEIRDLGLMKFSCKNAPKFAIIEGKNSISFFFCFICPSYLKLSFLVVLILANIVPKMAFK